MIKQLIHHTISTTMELLYEHSYLIGTMLPIFLFILIMNLIGSIPYAFTTTAQFITSFGISFMVFIGSIIKGIIHNRLKWLDLFLPSGVPIALAPLLICIEILSFSSRVISLSVRLSANMIAGHTLLHMISGGLCLIINLSFYYIPFLLSFPLSILIILFIIELGIAFLQAYVFVLLSLSYIHDAIYLH